MVVWAEWYMISGSVEMGLKTFSIIFGALRRFVRHPPILCLSSTRFIECPELVKCAWQIACEFLWFGVTFTYISIHLLCKTSLYCRERDYVRLYAIALRFCLNHLRTTFVTKSCAKIFTFSYCVCMCGVHA